MSDRFVFTQEAETQLLEIIEYVAAENPQAAARIGAAIHDALGQLAAMPEMGHTRPDLTARPLKFWAVFSYLIAYDPASAPLTVIAILHGARDLEQLLRNI